MSIENPGSGDASVTGVDPEEQHAEAVRRIRESAAYEQVEEALVNALAIHAQLPEDDRVIFDGPLAHQCVQTGVMLASCGLIGSGSPRQMELAQSIIDCCWARLPVFRQGKGDRATALLLSRAAPWEIALVNIVNVGSFMRHLVATSETPLSDDDRAFATFRDLFSMLRSTATRLPHQLRDAADAFASATAMKDLPGDVRQAVSSATTFLLGMRGENEHGEVAFRIGLRDLGGRGDGRKLSPWGAAKEIVSFFGFEMKDKMSEVA